MSTKSQPPPPSSSGPPPLVCVIGLAHEGRRESIRRRRIFEAANPVKARHRRQAREFEASLKAFVALNDGTDIGCLTITSVKRVSWQEEGIKLKRTNRLLNAIFPGGWVRFAEFTERGVIHHHVVGRASDNLAEGYDHESYHRLKELNERRMLLEGEEKRELAALRKRRFGNVALERLTDDLRAKLPKFGFGVVTELAPIRENIEAVAGYAIGGYFFTLRHGKDRPKGGRLYSFSRNFPRVKLPPTEGQLLCRRQIEFVCEAMGGPEKMTERYGSRWGYLILTHVLDELLAFPGPSDLVYWDPTCVAMAAERLLAPFEKKPISSNEYGPTREDEVLGQLQPLPGFASY